MTVEKAVHRLTEAGLKISHSRGTIIHGGSAILPIESDESGLNLINVKDGFSIAYFDGMWHGEVPIGQVVVFVRISEDILVATEAICTLFQIDKIAEIGIVHIARAMFTLERNGLVAEIDTPRKGILVRLNPDVFEDQRTPDKTMDFQILITPQEKRWQATLSENTHPSQTLEAETIDGMVDLILKEVENRPYFVRKPEEEQDA